MVSFNDSLSYFFEENSFEPYENYSFNLEGIKDGESNTTTVLISMVEIGIHFFLKLNIRYLNYYW